MPVKGPEPDNEEITKMALITPFLQAMGDDIFNPLEVTPAYAADLPGIRQGEQVDSAVLENGEPKIPVEAGAHTLKLKDTEMREDSRNGSQTILKILEDAETELMPINNPNEIYNHADRVRAALKAKLGR